ncbi:protein C1orf43-like isoform 2-T3 [Anableps anableps]
MRFAMRSRRGPHAPIGHNAPKELKQVIEAKLCLVQKIHFEPRLLSPADDRVMQRRQSASDDYLYRMKALDAIRDTAFPFRELGGTPSAVTGKRFRTRLLQLKNSHYMLRDKQNSLIDTVLDGYNRARHGAEAFGKAEFIKYQEALTELANSVKSRSSMPSQYHQSAAEDLSGTIEPTSPSLYSCSFSSSSSFSTPTQIIYLTSASPQQPSSSPIHFLELKNFKDNYKTLDSML